MAKKSSKTLFFLWVFMIMSLGQANDRACSATVKMNVFERFRHEMTRSQEAASAKFMTPRALAKWKRDVRPAFYKYDPQLSHFFAFAMLMPKQKGARFLLTFFNPWVDGALLTSWRKAGANWKMEDFYFASGERVRGEAAPGSVIRQSQILPIWQWYKGPLLRNIVSYYKDMRARLAAKKADEYLSWFSLGEAEKKADLFRVKLRMATREKLTGEYTVKSAGGPVLAGAFAKLKYDALTGNNVKLSKYSQHADILIELRPEIIKTLRENWIFKKNGVYSVILSSSLFPRSFILMNIETSGAIEGAFFCDLETMASMLRAAASTVPAAGAAQPVAPAKSPRKVQSYNDANGNLVEIITERRDGKVTQTTRINGKITNVVTF